MFRLENLDLNNFDTKNVVDIEGMFSGCSVENLNINNFDTKYVNEMGHMFHYCRNLKK